MVGNRRVGKNTILESIGLQDHMRWCDGTLASACRRYSFKRSTEENEEDDGGFTVEKCKLEAMDPNWLWGTTGMIIVVDSVAAAAKCQRKMVTDIMPYFQRNKQPPVSILVLFNVKGEEDAKDKDVLLHDIVEAMGFPMCRASTFWPSVATQKPEKVS